MESPERRHGYHVGVLGHRRTRAGRVLGLYATFPDGLDGLLHAAASLLELRRLHGRGAAPRLTGGAARVVVYLPP